MNPEFSTRSIVLESVQRELTTYASRYEQSNKYGHVVARGDSIQHHGYVCYAYLSSAGRSIPAFFGNAVYRQDHNWPKEEQNLFFEFALDPVRSPWRQLLEVLDYEVCRDKKTNIITGLIIYSTKVNRYILMQFMKMLRQVYERSEGIKIFTDSVKGRYEPGTKKEYTEAQEKFLLDAFCLSQMFTGSGGSVQLSWGGEHMNFHGLPSGYMFNREIKDFDKNIRTNTFFENSSFQSGVALQVFAFGQMGHDHATSLQAYAPVISSMIKSNKDKEVKIVGNLFTKPTPVAPHSTTYFKLQDILALVPAIARDLRSKV